MMRMMNRIIIIIMMIIDGYYYLLNYYIILVYKCNCAVESLVVLANQWVLWMKSYER